MNITEIAFTCYPATDLAASRAFYENLIGLKPTQVHPMGEDGGWVEYEIGPHCFSIGKTDGWQPNPRHPLADDRLMRLCQQGGIGWLARCDAAAMSPGPERTRSARLLPDRWQLAWQRALFHSLQPPTGDGPPAA